MAEFLWVNLEDVKFVNIPVSLIFAQIVIYILAGGVICVWASSWTFTEGAYFSFVSIFTIGLGDFVPQSTPHRVVILFYLFIGLVITTSCIDIVGTQYFNRIHYFGRQLGVQERRIMARQKLAMRSLFLSMAAFRRIGGGPNGSRAESGTGVEEGLETTYVADGVMDGDAVALVPSNNFHRQKSKAHFLKKRDEPPEPPTGFRVSLLGANGFRLSWDQPKRRHYGKTQFWFTLSYAPRLRQGKEIKETLIDFIHCNEIEVGGLVPVTLYCFSLCTSTPSGRSDPVFLEEYTEPSTVPQGLYIEKLGETSATLSWRSPIMHRKNAKKTYVVGCLMDTGGEDTDVSEGADDSAETEYWNEHDVGGAKETKIRHLVPGQRYRLRVTATGNHNVGFTNVSAELRFRTQWSADYGRPIHSVSEDDILGGRPRRVSLITPSTCPDLSHAASNHIFPMPQ